MNAISTLTILPQTKSDIDNYVQLLKADILSGYINPLKSALMLKSFEDILKALKSDEEIKRYIREESDKYTEKTIDFEGAKLSKQDRQSYDYSECNDSVWNDLSARISQLECELKGREAWLKTLKTLTPDTNTGEMILPPKITYNSIISITLKK